MLSLDDLKVIQSDPLTELAIKYTPQHADEGQLSSVLLSPKFSQSNSNTKVNLLSNRCNT